MKLVLAVVLAALVACVTPVFGNGGNYVNDYIDFRLKCSRPRDQDLSVYNPEGEYFYFFLLSFHQRFVDQCDINLLDVIEYAEPINDVRVRVYFTSFNMDTYAPQIEACLRSTHIRANRCGINRFIIPDLVPTEPPPPLCFDSSYYAAVTLDTRVFRGVGFKARRRVKRRRLYPIVRDVLYNLVDHCDLADCNVDLSLDSFCPEDRNTFTINVSDAETADYIADCINSRQSFYAFKTSNVAVKNATVAIENTCVGFDDDE